MSHLTPSNSIRSRSSNFLQKIPGAQKNFMLSTYSSWANKPKPAPKNKTEIANIRKKNFLTDVLVTSGTIPSLYRSSMSAVKNLKTEPNKREFSKLHDEKIRFSQQEEISYREPSFKESRKELTEKIIHVEKKKPFYSVEKLRKKFQKKKKKNKNVGLSCERTLNRGNFNLKKNTMPFISSRIRARKNKNMKNSNFGFKQQIIDVREMKLSKMINNLSLMSDRLSIDSDPLRKLREEFKKKSKKNLRNDNDMMKLRLDDGTLCNSQDNPLKDENIYFFEDGKGNKKLGFLEKEIAIKRIKKKKKCRHKSKAKKRLRDRIQRRKLNNLVEKLKKHNINPNRARKAFSPRKAFTVDRRFKHCQKLIENLRRLREIQSNDEMLFDFFSKITGESSALLRILFDKNKKFNEDINEFKLIQIFKYGGGLKNEEKIKKKIAYRFPLSKRQYIKKIVSEREKDPEKAKQKEMEFKQSQIDDIRRQGNLTTEINMIPVMCQASRELLNELQKKILMHIADDIVARSNKANKKIHQLRFKYSDYFGNDENNLNKKIFNYPRAYFSNPDKDEKNPLRRESGPEYYEDPKLYTEDLVSSYRKVEKMLTPMVLRHHHVILNNVGFRNKQLKTKS